MKKYLAMEYGQKRTGIAASDAGGSMAFARTTLESAPPEAFWRKLLTVIAEETPEGLVLGLRGVDARRLVDAVQARLDELAPRLPKGMSTQVFYNRGELVSRAAGTVVRALVGPVCWSWSRSTCFWVACVRPWWWRPRCRCPC